MIWILMKLKELKQIAIVLLGEDLQCALLMNRPNL